MANEEHPGIARYKEERDRFRFMYELSQQAEDPEMKHAGLLGKLMSEARGRIVDAYEAGEPFVANNYCTAPEVAVAMDLPWLMLYDAPFMGASEATLHDEIDATAAMGLGSDLCTAIRSSIYYVENDLVPIPTAVVGFIFPCDGMAMLHQVIRHSKGWRHVPMFSPDPPYFPDHRSVDYFANELRKMAAFLEQTTGRKLDLYRLKAVIEEGEKQYALWLEYNELRRARPCPHGFDQGGAKCFTVAQFLQVGQPEGTRWFAELVALAEERVKKGVGAVAIEKIRLFWFDIMPTGWTYDFMPWLEQEWGAVIVMDMFGNHPYTPIDTSSEEEMWRGLAKRGVFDTPMVRQATGPAEGFVNDLVRIVKDYQIDVVVWPGHMGHKESLATFGIMRETCRELRVPFLDLRVDIFDKRYTTPDQIKDKFSQFFTGLGLG
jgi:benzoyl-CoA reductase/2-hydroxyglutaryl-CoA dehydratase subunit BcrC/BadD/HgdB